CIYCDGRSECYQIEDFDGEVLVKVNAIELLRDELSRKQAKGLIALGSMNDCYMPLEREVQLTRRAMEVIAEFGFPVHVLTKSDLVLRDLALFQEIHRRARAVVSFTITTADDDLARKVEPGAPASSARFAAMAQVAQAGVETGVMLMPVLPFIEDTPENVTAIVERAVEAGASHVVPWFGMSMRDRQRAHFYTQLDRHFAGVRPRYQRTYGDRYSCESPRAAELHGLLDQLKTRYGFATHVEPYHAVEAAQLALF
ncbi:MAG: SPL family radical SAM protein, partial [Anaerolineae bacterium]